MLKFTKCDKYCDFSAITSFCFDCPALMCNTCKRLMHESLDNKNHKFISFDNNHLNWNCKETISNLFTDKVMEENIFTEVSRMFIKELNDDNAWDCSLCTTTNSGEYTRCHICCHVPIGRINISGYEKKLNSIQEKLCSINSEFKSMTNIPFENVLYRFFCNKNNNKLSILDWFDNVYLKDKHLSIINEVIIKLDNNHVEEDRLITEYDKCIQLKNKQIAGIFSNRKFKPSKLLISCDDINKSNILGKEFFGRELRDTDVWELICKNSQYSEANKRMIITEFDFQTPESLTLLTRYMNDDELGEYLEEACFNGNVKLQYLKQAIDDNFTISSTLEFLRKSCPICAEDYPIPEMLDLMACEHSFCKLCMIEWLREIIESKYPCKWNCPCCDDTKYKGIDKNMYYNQLKRILDSDRNLISIFENKLLEEHLMRSENFHWCANEECTNGFESEANSKLQCPSCKSVMCGLCNRMWRESHEGISCKEFELWMLKNDPNLSNLLKNIGIECPNCGIRYALAAGRILHFDCRLCGVKFCGGCDQLFVYKCNKRGCEMGNFHSHHPRNCLYFLRDYEAKDLENMLKGNDYPKHRGKANKKCQFMITTDKLMDVECGKDVYSTTGVCDTHYKEYLVQFVNRYQIDPADFVDSNELNQMLFQMALPKLKQSNQENNDAFKARLKKEVKEKCMFYTPKHLQ